MVIGDASLGINPGFPSQEVQVTEVDIDGRTFWVHPVGSWVLESGNVVAEALEISLAKPVPWAVGFFFGNTELSVELRTIIAGGSALDDRIMYEVVPWVQPGGLAIVHRDLKPGNVFSCRTLEMTDEHIGNNRGL